MHFQNWLKESKCDVSTSSGTGSRNADCGNAAEAAEAAEKAAEKKRGHQTSRGDREVETTERYRRQTGRGDRQVEATDR